MNNLNNNAHFLLNSVPNIKREILSYLDLEDLKSVRLTCKELHKRVSEVSRWKPHEIKLKVIAQIPRLKNIREKILQSYQASHKIIKAVELIGPALMWLGIGKIVYTAYSYGVLDKTASLITIGVGCICTPFMVRDGRLQKDLQKCYKLLREAKKYRVDESDPILAEKILQKSEKILLKYK